MLLDQIYNLLQIKYDCQINELTIADVRVGVFLTAVLLSDGSCGVASTDLSSNSNCYIKKRDFSEFSPSKIKGQKVQALFDRKPDKRIINSLKTAVINALSSRIISKTDFNILDYTDPIDLIDLSSRKTITMVGAFQSYIKKIGETDNKLYVLELNENALKKGQKQYYVPATEYPSILPQSDIVIITGLSLVNNTFDDLLSSISRGTQVIVTGPSSSMIPDLLFERKVDIVGSAKITDPDVLFRVVSEAGTGFHLFKYCAEKYCVVNGQ